MENTNSGDLIINVDVPVGNVNIPVPPAPPEKMLRWTVTVDQDGDDLILPLPEDMLQAVGWGPGDTLIWTINEDQTWTLRKKEQSVPGEC